MTEKKQQSTVQHEQTQGFASPAEDELDFIDLLEILARKKVFILAVTSVCTLFAIFHAQSIIPTYRATVGLLEPDGVLLAREVRSSFSALRQIDPKVANQVSKTITKPYSIFERFLSNIKSQELRQEVFVNGGFQKKFFRETGIGTDQFVSSTYIVKRGGKNYLELEGSKPKVMLEFLIALVETAKENVNTEINDIQSSIVKTRINNLSKKKQIAQIEEQIAVEEEAIEMEELRKKSLLESEGLRRQLKIERQQMIEKITMEKQIEKETEAIKIARFSDALAMAKRMGIKNNNFGKVKARAPMWFQYGELALLQEIKMSRSKKKETSESKSLSLLKLEAKLKLARLELETKLNLKKFRFETKIQSKSLEQKRYQNIRRLKSKKEEISEPKSLIIKKLTSDLPLLKFKVVIINKQRYFLMNPNKPWLSVVFGVVFGLVIGIVMAFLIDLKQLKTKGIPSASN